MKRLLPLLGLVTLFFFACSDNSKEDSYLNIETATLTFAVEGESKELIITSNSDWSITGLPTWLKASAVSGIGNSAITLTAEANDAIDDRNSSFNVYTNDGAVSREIAVKQEGTHVSPLQIDDVSKKIFSGKSSTNVEDSIVVTSNTRWTIEGPTWLRASFRGQELPMNGETIREGSGVIYLSSNETYTSEEAREATITIKTLTAIQGVDIPVRQLGKDDIQYTNPIILSDGFLFRLKFGSNVSAFRWMVYEEDLPPSELTYDNIMSYWVHYNASDDFVLYVGNASPNTPYYLYFIGIKENNYFTTLDHVNKQIIMTASDVNQPMANITDVTYANGEWQWNMAMNSYAKGFYFQAFYKSYYEGMNLTLMKAYFAYLMMYTKPLYFQKSASQTLPTTDDLIICTWAVGTDGERSTTIDMHVAEKPSQVKTRSISSGHPTLQTGCIDLRKLKDAALYNTKVVHKK